jgi:hypothetical protein
VVEYLKENFKLSEEQIFEEPCVRSPAQIEKFLTKEQKPSLSEIINAESTGTTLAEASDPRPEVGSKLEFDKITEA